MNDDFFQIGDFFDISPKKPIDTWLFDPPYNVGYSYGLKVNDSKKDAEYISFISKCAEVMFHNSKKDASLFYVNYQEKAALTMNGFIESGWKLHQWITWVYPSNIGMSNRKCTRASRAVLWFVKGTPFIDMKADVQPYKNPNDKRIKERIKNGSKGVNHYDWWEINLRKNTSKGFAGYYNQLPHKLVKRICSYTLRRGMVFGDLMAGSGPVLQIEHRDFDVFLNDIDPLALSIWEAS